MKKGIVYLLIIFSCVSTSAQNVGIGTAAPTARLHVADSSVVFGAVGIAPVSVGNTPLQGVGRRMMWYADKAAFRTGYASSDEWDKANIGKYSFATGYGVKALGDFSFSAGLNNTAGGQSSIAMGWNTLANANYTVAIGTQVFATGDGATALGYGNSAQGWYSFAMGYNNIAKSLGGTVFGQYNDIADNPNPGDTSLLDRVFQIGNGYYDETTDDEVRKNAITVLRNGNTGIGTVTPAARLHVSDSNVVFSGSTTIPASTTFGPPVQGPGTRMMWYPQKAAFRVGLVDGPYWDKDNIGRFSFATGWNSKASGEISFASGAVTIASGIYSTSMGQGSTASGGISTSLGFATNASGEASTSMGRQSNAIGDASTSMGYQTTASGNTSVSIGYQTTASGDASTSMGYQTTASGYGSTSMGRANNASGYYSTCIGLSNSSKAYGSFTAGLNNDTQDNPDPTLVVATDRIFQIGNGTTSISRNNAITVLRNGKVGIGTTSPATTVDIKGGNNWDLTNSEGDFRIGNDIYRIKMGIALDAGGAGAGRIRAAGGINTLYLGAGNTDVLTLFNTGNATLAGILTQNSDARMKSNIRSLQSSLQNIQQLNGYTYNWTDENKDQSLQIGILAQEVQKVYPQLVKKNDKDELSVNYIGLIPVLLEGIKEQQKEIDELKKLVEQLLKK